MASALLVLTFSVNFFQRFLLQQTSHLTSSRLWNYFQFLTRQAIRHADLTDLYWFARTQNMTELSIENNLSIMGHGNLVLHRKCYTMLWMDHTNQQQHRQSFITIRLVHFSITVKRSTFHKNEWRVLKWRMAAASAPLITPLVSDHVSFVHHPEGVENTYRKKKQTSFSAMFKQCILSRNVPERVKNTVHAAVFSLPGRNPIKVRITLIRSCL